MKREGMMVDDSWSDGRRAYEIQPYETELLRVLSLQPRSQGLSSYRPLERLLQGAVRWETLGTRLLSLVDSSV